MRPNAPLRRIVGAQWHLTDEEFKNLFNSLDLDCAGEIWFDGTGELTRPEITAIFGRFGITDKASVDKLFASIDASADESIDFDRFKDLMQDLCASHSLSLAERVFVTLESPESSTLGSVIGNVIMMTINVSVLAFVAESHPSYYRPPAECQTCEPVLAYPIFDQIEVTAIAIFTLEYMVSGEQGGVGGCYDRAWGWCWLRPRTLGPLSQPHRHVALRPLASPTAG
jgi:hypothetical protein